MRLYVVTMIGDTNSAPSMLNGLGRATAQVDAIEKSIDAAWTAIKQKMHADPKPFYQYVFVAPEYYFSNQRHQNDRFYSKDVKQFIVSRLSALAKKYDKLLIIPGTVLWKKAAYDEIVPGPLTIGTRVAPVKVQSAKSTARVQSALTRIANANALFGTENNAGGWSHAGQFGRDEGDGSNEANFDMPRYYLQRAKDLNTQIAQNVAYIYKGDVVLKYHKAGNYKEVYGEQSNIVFAPGNISGIFKVGTVTYGIEICRDHYQQVLAKAGQNVNIQIIISSYIDNDAGVVALQNGGVLIHSSTQKTQKTDNVDPIFFKDQASTKLVAAQRVGNSQLWIIDMDDKLGNITPSWSDTLTPVTLQAASHVH